MSVTIGIDARKLQDGGIGRYLRGLLGALARQDGAEEYVLFGCPGDPFAPPLALPASRFRMAACDAPLYGVRELFAFRGAATRHGIRLLHFPHYVRGFAPGCPVAVTIHDAIHLAYPPSPAAAVYARVMLGWAARSAAVLFTPTEASRRDAAARLRVREDRFVVTPNGVDESFAPPAAEEVERFRRARSLRSAYVLCMATHRPHKNLAAAIDAFAAADLSGAELIVPAATATDAAALRAIARAPVRVLAGVTDGELPTLYAGARIVLAPSLAEGFGLAPLEAAACGAAVIATGIPAHREVLADAAVFADPAGGAGAMAAALRALWPDDARRRDLAARGPRRAAAFRWEETARRTLEGYRSALA